MRDIELFLKLLAARVYEAKLGGDHLRDSTDFKAWLVKASEIAAISTSIDDFFLRLDHL